MDYELRSTELILIPLTKGSGALELVTSGALISHRKGSLSEFLKM